MYSVAHYRGEGPPRLDFGVVERCLVLGFPSISVALVVARVGPLSGKVPRHGLLDYIRTADPRKVQAVEVQKGGKDYVALWVLVPEVYCPSAKKMLLWEETENVFPEGAFLGFNRVDSSYHLISGTGGKTSLLLLRRTSGRFPFIGVFLYRQTSLLLGYRVELLVFGIVPVYTTADTYITSRPGAAKTLLFSQPEVWALKGVVSQKDTDISLLDSRSSYLSPPLDDSQAACGVNPCPGILSYSSIPLFVDFKEEFGKLLLEELRLPGIIDGGGWTSTSAIAPAIEDFRHGLTLAPGLEIVPCADIRLWELHGSEAMDGNRQQFLRTSQIFEMVITDTTFPLVIINSHGKRSWLCLILPRLYQTKPNWDVIGVKSAADFFGYGAVYLTAHCIANLISSGPEGRHCCTRTLLVFSYRTILLGGGPKHGAMVQKGLLVSIDHGIPGRFPKYRSGLLFILGK
ncbi:hypothetical protein Tco_1545908 [Tanacetum coccineum]